MHASTLKSKEKKETNSGLPPLLLTDSEAFPKDPVEERSSVVPEVFGEDRAPAEPGAMAQPQGATQEPKDSDIVTGLTYGDWRRINQTLQKYGALEEVYRNTAILGADTDITGTGSQPEVNPINVILTSHSEVGNADAVSDYPLTVDPGERAGAQPKLTEENLKALRAGNEHNTNQNQPQHSALPPRP